MWPALRPLFEKIIPSTNGCYEVDDVLTDILEKRQELWVSVDENNPKDVQAAMTTSFEQYPRKKCIKIHFIAGGHMRKWKDDFIAAFEEYAKKNGAAFAAGEFREGWVRMWPGSRIHGVTIIKDLA